MLCAHCLETIEDLETHACEQLIEYWSDGLRCSDCHGHGRKGGEECRACDGTGRISLQGNF